MQTFKTRAEAVRYIERCIEESSGGPADARGEYDVDGIAEDVIGDYESGYAIEDDLDSGAVDDFWQSVERHPLR